MRTIKFDNLVDSDTGQPLEIDSDTDEKELETIKEAGKRAAKKLKALFKDQEIVGVDTYSLSEVEQKNLNKFKKKHGKKCGMTVTVAFTSIGIGIGVDVFCRMCGKNKNISDYESW